MAVHIYGVVPAGSSLPDLPGVKAARLRLIADDVLAVVVSDVDEDARAGAADLLAHARVLETMVEDTTVVPMQFGVVLPDDDVVRGELLDRDGEELTELLRVFEGTVQLSLRILQDEEPALREVLARDAGLRELRERVRETVPASVPTAAQVRLGEAVTHALEDLAAEYADAVAPRLQQAALAVAPVDPAGVNEVLNAAYLVRRDARHQFDETVGTVRQEYAGRLSVRYIGPQPPYSFVGPARDGQLTWD